MGNWQSRPVLSVELNTLLTNADDGTVPESFRCPISQEIMRDPVVTADGHTYERDRIAQWLTQHRTSPLGGHAPLAHTNLAPNHALRNTISEFFRLRFKTVSAIPFANALHSY